MSNFYADEGTAAHWVFEQCMLKPKISADRFVGKTVDTSCVRTHSPYGPSGSKRWLTCPASVQHIEQNKIFTEEQTGLKITVTEEMAEAVQMAVDYVRSEFKGPGWKFFIEEEVHIPTTNDKGHIDLAAYHPKHGLHIVDYKHGAGIAVSSKKNSQMQLYALGMIFKLKYQGPVVLHIAQPRCKRKQPFDQWETDTKELAAFDKYARERIRLSKSNSPPYVVSDECGWCEKLTCHAYADKALSIAQQDFQQFVTEKPKKAVVKKLSNAQLSKIMNSLHILVDFVKEVPAEVKKRLEAGQKVPDWGIGEGRGHREWKNGTPVAALTKLGLDIDDLQPRTTISMTAIEALLPKSRKEAFMAKHTKVVPGKPTVQPLHKINNAVNDFEDLL